jgi:protein-S-isoprenylcysteine O-methyltransferase Ste14
MEYIILALGWMLFYSSHTLLASLKIKRKLRQYLQSSYKWYRLAYSFFSTVFFLSLFVFAGTINPDWLFIPANGSTYLGFMFATFGTIISVKSMKGISKGKFIGWQLRDDLNQPEKLINDGLYQYIRHPLYIGLLLIFIGYFLYVPNLASLIHLVALLLYLPFGIYYEEKKLLVLHGQAYADYQKTVPPLIPTIKI